MRRSSAVLVAWVISGCGASTEPPRAVEPPAETKEHAPRSATSAEAPGSSPAEPEAPSAPSASAVDLVEVDPPASPAKMPLITVSSPTKGQLIPAAKAADAEVKLSVRGWDIGPGREHLCVSLDAGPCLRVDDPKRAVKLSELSPKLAEGQHVLAVVARHASGEAVRARGKSAAFAAVSFFVEKRSKPTWKDGDPVIVALPPVDGPAKGGELLIDYYVGNAEVADGKYLAQIALAGPGINRGESSSSGKPFRVKNARAGGYLLRVALARYAPELGESSSTTTVKYSSKTMTGPLVDVTRTFKVAE